MRWRGPGITPPLLRESAFRTYWLGQGASLIGDQIRILAVPLTAVLTLQASPAAMGLLTAAGLLPSLLFSIHAGAFVDRRGKRRQTMLVSDLLRALLVLCIPAAYLLGLISMPLLIAISFLVGTCTTLFRVSASTLFVALVPKARYTEASTLLANSRAVAFLVGPGLGGYLAQLLTAPLALFADAFSFCLSALSLSRLRPQEPPPAAPAPEHATAGLRYIRSSGVLRPMLAAAGTASFCQAVGIAMYVVYVTRALQISPAELGIILGPGSIGAVAVTVLTGTIQRHIGLGRTLLLGTLLHTVPLLLVPFAQGPHALVFTCLLVAEGLSAAGLMVTAACEGAIEAAAVPDDLRARVTAAFEVVSRGIRPLGALIAAGLALVIGMHAVLWLAAVGGSLSFLWLLRSPLMHVRVVDEIISAS